MNEELVDVVEPYFSRSSVGKGKWFWVAYGSFSDMCDRKIHSSGMAASSDGAEKE